MSHPGAPQKPRRFYKTVTAEPAEGGFALRLDGRTAKSPGGAAMSAPTHTLALMLAAEWAAQEPHIDFAAMPVSRLVHTALDRTPGARHDMVAEVADYAGSDLLCYVASDPLSLAEREVAQWGPWLAWADSELGVALKPSVGIAPAAQDPAALARVGDIAAALDDFHLTGVAAATALYGSAVLALAVHRGALPAEEAYEISRLDEAFQQEQWGVDAEAAARTEAMREEARTLGRWFEALKG